MPQLSQAEIWLELFTDDLATRTNRPWSLTMTRIHGSVPAKRAGTP